MQQHEFKIIELILINPRESHVSYHARAPLLQSEGTSPRGGRAQAEIRTQQNELLYSRILEALYRNRNQSLHRQKREELVLSQQRPPASEQRVQWIPRKSRKSGRGWKDTSHLKSAERRRKEERIGKEEKGGNFKKSEGVAVKSLADGQE